MTAQVAGRLVTAFPTQDCSTQHFYGRLEAELARIQNALGASEASGEALVPGSSSCEQQVPDYRSSSGNAFAQLLGGVRQLETELQALHRLDDSILRMSDAASLLGAPPMLAPGPAVTGAGSAAVRLKQLRAAYVARSQQVNMAHNRYKCLSKTNDLYKTYVRLSQDRGSRCSAEAFGSGTSSPTSTMVPASAFASHSTSHTSSASEDTPAAAVGGVSLSSYSCASSGRGSDGDFLSNADCQVAAAPTVSGGGGSIVPMDYETPFISARGEVLRKTHSVSPASVPVPVDVSACAVPLPEIMDTDMEVAACSPQASSPPVSRNSGRRGFFSALFGRGRSNDEPKPNPIPKQQPAPMDDLVPASRTSSVSSLSELRRSFSEPVVYTGRRAAIDLGSASDGAIRQRTFGMDDAGSDKGGPSARRSRDKGRRSGENKMRVRSEPAPLTRDQRRRRGFQMEEADDDVDDEFGTTDLFARSSLFNSEQQLHREDECYDSFKRGSRRLEP